MTNARLYCDWISRMRRTAASATLVLAGTLVLALMPTQSAHAALTTLYSFCATSNTRTQAPLSRSLPFVTVVATDEPLIPVPV